MGSGLGAFEKEVIPIKAGEDAWETDFTPSWFGPVEFSASTFGATVRDGVESVKVRTLSVTLPWPYLLLYFLPASLAFLLKSQKDGKPWKESLPGRTIGPDRPVRHRRHPDGPGAFLGPQEPPPTSSLRLRSGSRCRPGLGQAARVRSLQADQTLN